MTIVVSWQANNRGGRKAVNKTRQQPISQRNYLQKNSSGCYTTEPKARFKQILFQHITSRIVICIKSVAYWRLSRRELHDSAVQKLNFQISKYNELLRI